MLGPVSILKSDLVIQYCGLVAVTMWLSSWQRVWYALFDEDTGPTNKFFESVKNCWSDIDTNLPVTVLDGDIYNKQEALVFYRDILSRRNRRNEYTIRDDYRELVELGMLLLGEQVPGGMTWKKPGATHKARFCNFGIYTLTLPPMGYRIL